MRTTFDPTQGPFRLIFAFEAVIMGGMGSIWGTLVGGIVLGRVPDVGSQAFGAGWGILVGHVVFLAVLAVQTERLLREDGDGMSRRRAPSPAFRVARSTRMHRYVLVVASLVVAVLASVPLLGAR